MAYLDEQNLDWNEFPQPDQREEGFIEKFVKGIVVLLFFFVWFIPVGVLNWVQGRGFDIWGRNLNYEPADQALEIHLPNEDVHYLYRNRDSEATTEELYVWYTRLHGHDTTPSMLSGTDFRGRDVRLKPDGTLLINGQIQTPGERGKIGILNFDHTTKTNYFRNLKNLPPL